MTERVLPHDLEAERAVLGAVLLDNARLVDARAVTEPGRFYRDAHRRIFGAMVAIGERQEAIDPVTLKDQLTRTGDLEEVGGAVYIASLLEGVPRSSNIDEYARIVEEKAALRDLVQASGRMLASAYDSERKATEILESAEQAILGLASSSKSAGFESMATIATRAMAALERAHQTKAGISGVATGFIDLDNLTRGLQPGTLIVLGARPGMGKTSLANNISANAAAGGRAVGFFSLEMPSDELFIRQIAAHARIDSHRLQSGYLGEREWGDVAHALGVICDLPLYVDETGAINIFDVRSRARRLLGEHGLDLLVVDYLQLMGKSSKYENNRNLEVGAITGALKALSKELKIPVLLLSQLSRDPEKRGGRPKLSDLRDSGSIEQDADIVLFLYREENTEDTSVADLIVAKHRNGSIGTIKLTWSDRFTRYDNYAPHDEPQDRRLPMGDR